MTEKFRMTLRFLVYPEGEWWFAHCLELDIVAEGKTDHEAFADVLRLCALQIETAIQDGDLESIFRPAPAEFWRLFSLAKDYPEAVPPAPELPYGTLEFEARELALA
jgi:hypothetical protein